MAPPWPHTIWARDCSGTARSRPRTDKLPSGCYDPLLHDYSYPLRTQSHAGLLHIGGVRTALFSWLYSRRHGGRFILRVEDTDRERSTEEAVQVILDGMQWLGLAHDEGPYFQSQRFGRYTEVLRQMLDQGNAYHCYCSKQELEDMRNAQLARKEKPRYDGRCRQRTAPVPGAQPVIRFKNPLDGAVVVEDLVHGPVVFQNAELDDLIIARSDGTPTYNFCVVVDDSDMHITHVIRGDDHLNNTPRQINMLRAIGFTPPPAYTPCGHDPRPRAAPSCRSATGP